MLISLTVVLLLISVSAQGIITIRAAGMLASAVCIIFSLQVVETDAAVIGVVGIVVGIVRTAGIQGAGGVEHAFAAGAGAGCCLQVLETLRHALVVSSQLESMWRLVEESTFCSTTFHFSPVCAANPDQISLLMPI